MAEPHSTVIAVFSAIIGGVIAGAALMFNSGRTLQKVLSELTNLRELIETNETNIHNDIKQLRIDVEYQRSRMDAFILYCIDSKKTNEFKP